MIEIHRVTSMVEAVKVVPIEVMLKGKGRITTSVKDFLTLVHSVLNNPLFGFWIAYDDGKVVGYILALISPIRIFDLDYVSVIRIWAGKSEAAHKLDEVLCEWSRENKINRIRMETKRHLKPINRKYHFTPVSVTIERRI
jgi:hypothetical protein